MPLFGPRITIFTRDGKSYTLQGTGREFIWDFAEQAKRIRPIVSGLPIPESQFDAIIQSCGELDRLERADALVKLMLKQ
jgi:pentatricopeptide repeat protein